MTTSLKKYHIQKGFPKNITFPTGKYLLNYSRHARREAERDRYAPLQMILPCYIDFSTATIFEIETENDMLVKMACRINFNKDLDLTLVIMRKDFSVKTVWFNQITYRHEMVDLPQYNRP